MKIKRLFSSILVGFILLALSPSRINADGMILPPDWYPRIYETSQKALLIYKDGREDLVISISFEGEASEFGWIIPLPNKPDISKVDYSIFRKLDEFTEPKENLLEKIRGDRNYYYGGYTTLSGAPKAEEDNTESTVQVVEEKSIGIFDYAVLTTEDTNDLKEWMLDNGYNLPTADETYNATEEVNIFPEVDSQTQAELWSEALPIIKDYIDDGWYFVAVKINNEYTDSTGTETKISEGAVDPLRFSFETKDIIYPMRLSAINKRDLSVTLYVIDDHKVEVSNYNYDNGINNFSSEYNESSSDDSYFSFSYAGKIKNEDIDELTKEVGKGSWFSSDKDLYITKLTSSSIPYSKMTEEVLFEDTKNNTGVNDGSMTFVEWVELPFVFIIYLPYLLMGGIFNIFSGSDYNNTEIQSIWFIVMSGIILVGSILGAIISTLLLRKARKKFIRFILYLWQFPCIWFLSFLATLVIVIPSAYAISLLAGYYEDVVMIDSICCFSFLIVVFPLIFYRLLWKRRGICCNKEKKKQLK